MCPTRQKFSGEGDFHTPFACKNFPANVLGREHNLALLFKNLATLRTDAPLFKKVETLRWRGPTPDFAAWAERMEAPRLLERCEKAAR